MKFYKTILPVFCFILILTAGLDVQAEEWKSVIDSGDINYQIPGKKGCDSDAFVIHQGSNKEANSNDDNKPKKPLNIVFIRGYDAVTLVPSQGFKTAMKKAFKGHNVKFVYLPNQKEMTKNKTLESFQGADVLLLNAHASQNAHSGMQWLKVAKSDDNHDISPDGNSMLTSLDIKKAFHGKKKPKNQIQIGRLLLETPTPDSSRMNILCFFNLHSPWLKKIEK